MAGEIFEKYYDPDNRENSWADTEPKSKSIKDIQKIIVGGVNTKDELDIIEQSLKHWHDGDVTPEIFTEQ